MKLSDEALDAAIDAYFGGHNPGAQREFARPKFRAMAEALIPVIRDQLVAQEGRQEWRVTGDPGTIFGPYDFMPQGLDSEEQARGFITMFTSTDHQPWQDGPHLWHRTVYTHEGPWIKEETP